MDTQLRVRRIVTGHNESGEATEPARARCCGSAFSGRGPAPPMHRTESLDYGLRSAGYEAASAASPCVRIALR